MTVSEIRELMLEKVIPESLLPQNIAVCLMDENAAPPELDAYTFLNRLRSLGIGSADFLYLLEGCGAPEEAISRIKQHPDMNLQSLIVTLDGSGLTPKDYTRMLYTARQLWERTVTMRIEAQDIEQAEQEDQAEQPETAPEPEKQAQPAVEAPEKHPEKAVRTARQKKKTDEEPVDFHEYVGVKPIGRQRSESGDSSDEPDGRVERYTAIQLKPRPDEPDEPDEPDDHDAEAEEPAPRADDPRGRRNAITACAVGAAVLCALCPAMDMLGFTAPDKSLSEAGFAAGNDDIFAEIYTAYSGGSIGGGAVQRLPGSEQVFGGLLVQPGSQLGVFTVNDLVYSAEPEKISVCTADGIQTAQILPPEGAEFMRVFQTEDGITAVYSSEQECGLTGISGGGAEWTSGQSGKLTDIFTNGDVVRLGSVYTPAFTRSFSVEDTLEYLPWTSRNGTPTAFSAAETVLCGSQGCSYAVNVEYSPDGGQKSRIAALGDPIFSGAERFAAAMRTDGGSLLVFSSADGSLCCTALPEMTACAFGGGIFATAEKPADDAEGSGAAIYLRGDDGSALSAFTTGGSVDMLRISGGVLYAGCDGKTVLAADISDPASPKALDLTSVSGVVSGEYALCGAKTPGGISLTLYKLEGGNAVQADTYAKVLSAAELESLTFGGANTFVIDGADCCGAAYRYFDGVSVVDEFAELGRSRSLHTLYDDKAGYSAAALVNGGLLLIRGSDN